MEPLDPSNGILGRIPGEFVSAGSRMLPPPGPTQPRELWAEVDTTSTWSGLVRIRYELRKSRHAKNTSWYWTAAYAERADAQPL